MQPLNVLSTFDGCSCAKIALKKAKLSVSRYFSSEIDPYAMQVSQKSFKDIHQLGDIKNISGNSKQEKPQYLFLKNGDVITSHYTGGIDLLIGGFPCTDLSIAKKNRKGLKGNASGLFYEMVRLHKEVKPKYFVYENVASMAKDQREIILNTLKAIDPKTYVVEINAALLSAQHRKRLFFTNIPNVTQPKDKGILLNDIIHETRGEKFDLEKYIVKGNHLSWIQNPTRLKKKYSQINSDKALTMMARQYANWNGQYMSVRVGKIGNGGQGDRIYSLDGKSVALSALGGGRGAKTGLYLILQKGRGNNKGGIKAKDGKTPTLSSSSWEHNNHLLTDSYVRRLTPIECCRLQGLPDNHMGGVSDNQAYKMAGNAFNCDVVSHILKFIKKDVKTKHTNTKN